MNEAVKVYLLPLGCAKNLCNAELMLGHLVNAGMELMETPEGADVAIVNTCGFIESAKTEAIEAILELAELKKQGVIRVFTAQINEHTALGSDVCSEAKMLKTLFHPSGRPARKAGG